MSFLIYFAIIIVSVNLVRGIINPHKVIKWGPEKNKNRSRVLLIFGSLLVTLILFLSVTSNDVPTKVTEDKQSQSTQAIAVEYKIVEEKDNSYLGCKRVGVRIVVPDDSKQKDVDNTLDKIINNYKLKNWQSVTVWAWKYSEEEEMTDSNIAYTKGLKEYSVCE